MKEEAAVLNPTVARLILIALAALLFRGVFTSIPAQPAASTPDKGDAALFRTVIERVMRGETYYHAMGDELRSRGYPTASAFNWRTPLLFQAVAYGPRTARILLLALGIVSIIATAAVLMQALPETLLVGLLLQVGCAASIVLISNSFTVPEVWTGYLVFLSLFAYIRDWRRSAVLLALLALFVRELVAPYCVICTVIAFRNRRWSEFLIWCIGAGLYAVYFWIHLTNVHAAIEPGAVAHERTWIQFGGLSFVLGTLSFNGWFAASQPWGPAIGLTLIIASLWATAAPLHLKATVVAYLAFFAAVGQVFNQNWGLIAAPAWALACGYGVEGLRRLFVSARGAPRGRVSV